MGIEFDGNIKSLQHFVNLEGTQKTGNTRKNQIGLIMQNGSTATKKITSEDIEKAVNEPSSRKAIKGLLANSPLGLTEVLSNDSIEKMGYTFVGTAFHKGAPALYKSADGGTITVYSGKGTAEMGEDKRKIVYQNDRYTQEMYYDENGKLTQGKIIIKDNVAGFTEAQYDFIVKDNEITTIIT